MTYYSPEDFPWAVDIADNWRAIRTEYEQLHDNMLMSWPESEIYEGGWEVFGLHAFGNVMHDNCDLCPVTTELVRKIPDMTTSGFSVLKPGSHILPHTGYTDTVLRFHLGLIVPTGCAIQVGDTISPWVEGGCIIFDDTVEHEAWNSHDKITRAILLVDFLKPDLLPKPMEPYSIDFPPYDY
jgi:aspartyl/asparaginyl beta-hydroxylase (cupin superfamily)